MILCWSEIGKQIRSEIGITGCGNNTYCISKKSWDEIVDEHTLYKKRSGFKIPGKEKFPLMMHWIAKMHKNPTGKRFDIASKICSKKQISKSFSNVSKLVNSQIENFHKNAKFFIKL